MLGAWVLGCDGSLRSVSDASSISEGSLSYTSTLVPQEDRRHA